MAAPLRGKKTFGGLENAATDHWCYGPTAQANFSRYQDWLLGMAAFGIGLLSEDQLIFVSLVIKLCIFLTWKRHMFKKNPKDSEVYTLHRSFMDGYL